MSKFSFQIGRETMLNDESALNILIQSLFESNVKVKCEVLKLLNTICHLNGGHSKVMKAINYYKVYADERIRLQV